MPDPNLLVGFENSEDAGVYRLTDEIALVVTADFITPPVDDPYLFGQIAAANALSDIYAMGGRPLTCLNLVNFPGKKLGPEVLHQIIAGALNKITEAGAVLAGGHTVEDEEPKFGLSVTGIVHPQKFWRNNRAQVGDALILTKPIGSGVLFNANRKRWVSSVALGECLEVLVTLNKTAAEVAAQFEIHAATDITGFGLAGHSWEMARQAEGSFRLEFGAIPLMREALEMYQRGMTTGANAANLAMVTPHWQLAKTLSKAQQQMLIDPQTSGGLLLALPKSQALTAREALQQAGVWAAQIIGEVLPLEASRLMIV